MITQTDLQILDLLQTVRTGFLDTFFVFITRLGDEGIIWILLTIGLLCFKKTRGYGITMAIALISGTIIGNLCLKNIIARPRPFIINPEMLQNLLINPPSSFSFPSGHTLSSFESAIALFMCNKKAGIPAIVLAALIGFSRNYLYVHYPTDVIAGAVLGVAIGIGSYFVYKKYIKGKILFNKIEL